MTTAMLFEDDLDVSPADREIVITVLGDPQPQGNKTAYPVRRKIDGQWVYTGKHTMVEGRRKEAQVKVANWRQEVAEQAALVISDAPPLDGSIAVRMTFTKARPAGHFRKHGELSAEGLRNPYPATRPDGGKYQRAVEDALKAAGVYTDDARIVAWVGFKVWVRRDGEWRRPIERDALEQPGVVIRVKSLI